MVNLSRCLRETEGAASAPYVSVVTHTLAIVIRTAVPGWLSSCMLDGDHRSITEHVSRARRVLPCGGRTPR